MSSRATPVEALAQGNARFVRVLLVSTFAATAQPTPLRAMR